LLVDPILGKNFLGLYSQIFLNAHETFKNLKSFSAFGEFSFRVNQKKEELKFIGNLQVGIFCVIFDDKN